MKREIEREFLTYLKIGLTVTKQSENVFRQEIEDNITGPDTIPAKKIYLHQLKSNLKDCLDSHLKDKNKSNKGVDLQKWMGFIDIQHSIIDALEIEFELSFSDITLQSKRKTDLAELIVLLQKSGIILKNGSPITQKDLVKLFSKILNLKPFNASDLLSKRYQEELENIYFLEKIVPQFIAYMKKLREEHKESRRNP